MELTNEQWNRIEPIISESLPAKNPRGRKPRDAREVLNEILWILRTGAPWKDIPPRCPPYQTCHRRFQEWIELGTFQTILHEIAKDLYERGKINIRDAFIDGSFAPAKKGSCCRQDKTWQRHQDHGNRICFWFSCRRLCGKRSPT